MKHEIWQGLNSPSIKRRTSEKETESSIKFHTKQHKSCLQLLHNLNRKKKYFPALTGPIVKPSKCCFHFVPWEMSLRELTLYFQFACDILYIREGSRFCLLFPFLPLLFPHPKYPLKTLFIFCSNNKAKQVKF